MFCRHALVVVRRSDVWLNTPAGGFASIQVYVKETEHDVVKVAVFPQPPKSLEMLPCNTMPVIPFHFSYYLFLFPSLCRSLRVLFKFICDLQYGNAPCIWPRGGGQKKKNGGFPSRRSQIFFFFWRPPPQPGSA